MTDATPPAADAGTDETGEQQATSERRPVNRRQLLGAVASSALVGTLAGCSGGSGSGPTATSQDAGTTTDGTATTASPTRATTTTPQGTVRPSCDDYETLEKTDLEGGATVEAGCYRIEDFHELTSGTLTFEPGVLIEFASDAGLEFWDGAALKSLGSDREPVFLLGETAEREHWRGLGFREGSATSTVENTVVAHAGSHLWTGDQTTRAALYVGKGALDVDGATVRDNHGRGLLAKHSEAALSVADATFTGNGIPVRLHADLVGGFAPSNAVAGNDDDRIHVRGGTDAARDRITSDQKWAHTGVPYYVPQRLRLTASLGIAAGTTFEFGDQQGLDVAGGRLQVAGTGDAPVVFRGDKQERGYWQGIRFRETTADNRLEHAVVRDAGGHLWHGADYSKAGVFLQGSESDLAVTIRNCTVANNAVCGLTATGSKYEFTVDACAFEGNTEPVRVAADLVQNVEATNAYSGNDRSYLRVGIRGARTYVHRETTWPKHAVPYRIDRDLSIRTDLSIAPGTTVEVGLSNRPNRTVTINVPGNHGGSLEADATDQSPIRFTGAEKEPGHWGGIGYSTANPKNVLSNVVVEHGGGELHHGDLESKACVAPTSLNAVPQATLNKVTIRKSAKHGIYKDCDAALACSELQFEAIGKANIWDAGEEKAVAGCNPTC